MRSDRRIVIDNCELNCQETLNNEGGVNRLRPGSYAADSWYLSDIRGNGTAEIVDLTGVGGNLETGQPLGSSAVRLTTGFENGDKAQIGTFGNFGAAASVLNNVNLGYSFYKQTVAGGNTSSAPSLKLALWAAGGTGDNYGELIWEPTWNTATPGSGQPTADLWQTVNINETTGADGATGYGGWWWTGGFEVPNSYGGPPINSLSEWASAFAADADFANASVVGLSVGIGTYNQGQLGYFDSVSFNSGGIDVLYDFEGPGVDPIPEPTSLMLLSVGIFGVALIGKKKYLGK